jgi:hypothetical protein
MPRGNDTTAQPVTESGELNAEQLISAVEAARSPEVEVALMKPLDEEATAALDLSTLSGPNGEVAINAGVRGGVTVMVYADATGRYQKCIAQVKTARSAKKSADKE